MAEPFVGASLLLAAFIMSRLNVVAGDGVAIYAVFAYAAALLKRMPVWNIAEKFLGTGAGYLDAFTLGVGAVTAVILGSRRNGAQGALLALMGYAAAHLLDVQGAVLYIASAFFKVFSFLTPAALESVITQLAGVIAAVIGSSIVGGGLAVVVMYSVLTLNSLINAAFSALNRAVYRMLLSLIDSPAWSILVGLGASFALALIPAITWVFTVELAATSALALFIASAGNIVKGTVIVGLGEALTALGTSILLAMIFGDLRKMIARAMRSLGGRPSLGTLAFVMAAAMVAGASLFPLALAAALAYYLALVLSLAVAASSPRPPRRVRAINAVADTLFTLQMMNHLVGFMDTLIEFARKLYNSVKSVLP